MFGLKTGNFGNRPIAHRQETGSSRGGYATFDAAGLASGLVAGTWVATAFGWRPVEAIAKGDLVLTFDNGMQMVRDITRGMNWGAEGNCPRSQWPLLVPAGALGNQADMTLMPDQVVMIESDAADQLFDDPFALLCASDLDGLRGIERIRPGGVLEVVQLHFDADEVVFANAGSLLFCPSNRMMSLSEMLVHCANDAYSALPAEEARMLVSCLHDEEARAGGRAPDAAPQVYAACA